MQRKEFLKICGILGVSLPFVGAMSSCKKDDDIQFSGKVLVIGAGAGGLAAGYLLQQQGIDFEILEASVRHGGRMRVDNNFTDFPIPLGAEWLETGTHVFAEIVNDSSVTVNVPTVADPPDRKFVNSSWLGFFETYIVPSVVSKIRYSQVVETIDYSGDEVLVTTQNGQLTADKVMVSVPLKILQDGAITFTPDLPQAKRDAISSSTIWEGFKAFFEFSAKFYDDDRVIPVTPVTDGEKVYYNAALGQNTSKNILGLFVVGKPAQAFTSRAGDDLRDFILNELDGIYANQATPNFVKYVTQDWTDEPYIKAGYLSDHADWQTVRTLGESVADKVYFAGGAYTDGEDWVSVHTAAQAAKRAVDELLA